MTTVTTVTSARTLVALFALMTGAVALAGGHGDVGVESIGKTVQSVPLTSTGSAVTVSSATSGETGK